MRFELDVYPRDRIQSLKRFIAVAGWDVWKKRIEELCQARQRSPVIQHYLEEKHAIEFELSRLYERKKATGRLPSLLKTAALYRLASLSYVVASVHSQLTKAGQDRLRGMLLDALKNDFGSLEHEMRAVAHFVSRGFDIELPDIEGTGRFDILARKDGCEMEVECKSVSYDAGRKIHRSDFNALADALCAMFERYIDENTESALVVLTLKDRLTTNSQIFSRIGAHVNDAIQHKCQRIAEVDFSVQCSKYEPEILPPDAEVLWKQIEDQIASDQFHMFVYGNSTCVVVFVATSHKRDRVLSAMLKQMRKVSDQCTGLRPAIVWVKVEGVYPHEWHTLSADSALQRMSYKYLAQPSRSHVHTVAYSSTGWLERRCSVVTNRGPVLCFSSLAHPMCDDPILRVFRE